MPRAEAVDPVPSLEQAVVKSRIILSVIVPTPLLKAIPLNVATAVAGAATYALLRLAMVLPVTEILVSEEPLINIPDTDWGMLVLVEGCEAFKLFAVLVLPIVLLVTVRAPVDSNRIPKMLPEPGVGVAIFLVVIDPILLLLIVIRPDPKVAMPFTPPADPVLDENMTLT